MKKTGKGSSSTRAPGASKKNVANEVLKSAKRTNEQKDGDSGNAEKSNDLAVKQSLVNFVKDFQRTSSYSYLWQCFCQGQTNKRQDPNAHEVDTLRRFIASVERVL
jgi:hypothetical protein